MTVSSSLQLFSLLWAAAAGALCGAMAAVMSAVGRRFRPGRGLVMAGDLLFWLLCGGVIIWLSLRMGDGGIRVCQLITAACFMALYLLCLGGLTRRLTDAVLGVLGVILSPLFFLGRGVKLYIADVKQKIGQIYTKIRRFAKHSTSVGKVRKKIRKNYKKMI